MARLATIESVCELVTDGTHYTPKDVGEGVPFLTVKDVSDFGLDFVGCSYITDSDYRDAALGNSAPKKGDVLFSKDGTVGKVHVVASDKPFAVLSSLAILRPKKDSVDPTYLGHALRSPITLNEALKKKTGSAIRRIILSDLKRVRVFLPPLPEQSRIAAILDQVDSLRAKRREALSQLDSLTQSIFIEMFGDPSRRLGVTRIDPLGKHLTFLTSGGRGWAKYYAESGKRFLRSLDVQMNRIGDVEPAFVRAPENAEARRTEVRCRDVLLTITGSLIGRVATVPDELAGAYISQHVAILRVNPSKLDPAFLSRFLSLDLGGQRQIAKVQYGQTKPGLNFEQIRGFQVPIPPLNMQHDFANRISCLERIMGIHQNSLADLNSLFASLQHRAFQGEL